ncbi:hypothetical protein ACFQV2_24235 [Actinokineospora soli]|uniref:Uncharacterized protein n=1 Tax=Actinokineospora soli TaxID=1048753 RepID=A0ABW2TS37_9PSEU
MAARLPAAIRAELVRVRQHLARPGPLSRADRDKAAFAVARLAECVDRLRAAHGLRRGAWLRASTPLVTLPHAALLGSALGTTTSAVVLHFQVGGAPWPALGWASGGVVAAVGCYFGAVLVTHRLVWWRRDVVLRTVEEELAALRVS